MSLRSVWQNYRRELVAAGLLLMLAWVGYGWAQTLFAVRRYYVPLPVWDYWDTVAHLSRYRQFDLSVLWVQHNEHRIVFPEIVFAADYLILHGRQVLPISLSCICFFAIWMVMAWAAMSGAKPGMQQAGWLAAFASGIVMSWRGSALALSMPFLLQWTLLQLAVISALALLARSRTGASRFSFYGAIASGVVANYSSANGLLVWPILILAALILRFCRRDLIILCLASLVSVALYFVGFQQGTALNLGNLVRHPGYLAAFVATYLSIPFGVRHYPTSGGARWGVYLGSLNLIAFAAVLLVGWRRGLLQTNAAIVLLGASSFSVASAVLTAAGRMNPQDSLYVAATASRYLTMPLANWAALAALCIWMAGQSRRARWLPIPVTIAIVFFACTNFTRLQAGSWLQLTQDQIAEQQRAALSLENGLRNPDTDAFLYPAPDAIYKLLPILKRADLSIYRSDLFRSLGKQLRSNNSGAAGERIPGEVVYTVPVPDGLEVVGWYAKPVNRADSGGLILVDEQERVIGLGRKPGAGVPPPLRSFAVAPALGWVGFVNLSYGSHRFRAYLIDASHSRLIPVGTWREMGALRAAGRADGQSTIPVQWTIEGSWAPNRLPKDTPTGEPPPGDFLSSWAGTDEATGSLTSSPLTTPASHCFVWPVLHGPATEDSSVEVQEGNGRRVIATVPLHELEGWHYWRVLIPEDVPSVRLRATDSGRTWGQWLAVGQPLSCR